MKTERALVFCLIAFSTTAFSQSEWTLKKEKDGIFIYTKKDTSHFNSIKVTAELRGTIKDLVSMLMYVERHAEWCYGTMSASVLKRISNDEIIFYKEIKSPGPVSNRDMVICLKVISNGSKSVTIESVALPEYIPRKENIVRVPYSYETWTVTPIDKEKLSILYYLQIDPGGELPLSLVNLFADRGTYETFANLKKRLADGVDSHPAGKRD